MLSPKLLRQMNTRGAAAPENSFGADLLGLKDLRFIDSVTPTTVNEELETSLSAKTSLHRLDVDEAGQSRSGTVSPSLQAILQDSQAEHHAVAAVVATEDEEDEEEEECEKEGEHYFELDNGVGRLRTPSPMIDGRVATRIDCLLMPPVRPARRRGGGGGHQRQRRPMLPHSPMSSCSTSPVPKRPPGSLSPLPSVPAPPPSAFLPVPSPSPRAPRRPTLTTTSSSPSLSFTTTTNSSISSRSASSSRSSSPAPLIAFNSPSTSIFANAAATNKAKKATVMAMNDKVKDKSKTKDVDNKPENVLDDETSLLDALNEFELVSASIGNHSTNTASWVPPTQAHRTFYNFHQDTYGAVQKKKPETITDNENIDETQNQDQNTEADEKLPQETADFVPKPSATASAILSTFFTPVSAESTDTQPAESILRPLPPGWELAVDAENREYFINHNTSTTTYQCPVYYKDLVDDEEIYKPRKVTLKRHKDLGFGFVAGSERPLLVRFVKTGGPSDNVLNRFDEILEINGVDVSEAPRSVGIRMIQACKKEVELLVRQPKLQSLHMQKSAIMTPSKKAHLRTKPSRVRFADGVTINGTPLFVSSATDGPVEERQQQQQHHNQQQQQQQWIELPIIQDQRQKFEVTDQQHLIQQQQQQQQPQIVLQHNHPVEPGPNNANVSAPKQQQQQQQPQIVLQHNHSVEPGPSNVNVSAPKQQQQQQQQPQQQATPKNCPHKQVKNLICASINNIFKVFLENGQTKTFRYDSATTIKSVLEVLMRKLNVRVESLYGIVAKDVRNSRVAAGNRMSVIDPSEKLVNVASRPNAHSVQCILRVVYAPPEPVILALVDPVSFDYLYEQCCNDLVLERYEPEIKYELSMRLTALRLYEYALKVGHLKAGTKKPNLRLRHFDHEYGLENFVAGTLMLRIKFPKLMALIRHCLKLNTDAFTKETGPMTEQQAKIHFLYVLAELPCYGTRMFTPANNVIDRAIVRRPVLNYLNILDDHGRHVGQVTQVHVSETETPPDEGNNRDRTLLVSSRHGVFSMTKREVSSANSTIDTKVRIQDIGCVRLSQLEDLTRFQVDVFARGENEATFSFRLSTKDANQFVTVIQGYQIMWKEMTQLKETQIDLTTIEDKIMASLAAAHLGYGKKDEDPVAAIRPPAQFDDIQIQWEMLPHWWKDNAPNYYNQHTVGQSGWHYPPPEVVPPTTTTTNTTPLASNQFQTKADVHSIDLALDPANLLVPQTETVRSIDARDSQLYTLEQQQQQLLNGSSRPLSLDVPSMVSMEILEAHGQPGTSAPDPQEIAARVIEINRMIRQAEGYIANIQQEAQTARQAEIQKKLLAQVPPPPQFQTIYLDSQNAPVTIQPVNRVIDNTSDTSSENVLGNAVAASDQQQQQHVLANNPTITQAVVHSDMYPQLLQAESALQQAMSNLAQIQQAQQGSSSSLSNTPLNCDQVVADLNALCQTFAELKADGIIAQNMNTAEVTAAAAAALIREQENFIRQLQVPPPPMDSAHVSSGAAERQPSSSASATQHNLAPAQFSGGNNLVAQQVLLNPQESFVSMAPVIVQQPQQQYMQYLLSHGNAESNDNVNIRPDSFYMAVEQFEQANRQLSMSCEPPQHNLQPQQQQQQQPQPQPPPPPPRSYMMVQLEPTQETALLVPTPQMSRTSTPNLTAHQVYIEDNSQQQQQQFPLLQMQPYSSSLPSTLGMCYHSFEDHNVSSDDQLGGTPVGQHVGGHEELVVEACNASTRMSSRAHSLTYLPYSSSPSSPSPSGHAQTQRSSPRSPPPASTSQPLSSLSMTMPPHPPPPSCPMSLSSPMDNVNVNHFFDMEGHNNLQQYASHHSHHPQPQQQQHHHHLHHNPQSSPNLHPAPLFTQHQPSSPQFASLPPPRYPKPPIPPSPKRQCVQPKQQPTPPPPPTTMEHQPSNVYYHLNTLPMSYQTPPSPQAMPGMSAKPIMVNNNARNSPSPSSYLSSSSSGTGCPPPAQPPTSKSNFIDFNNDELVVKVPNIPEAKRSCFQTEEMNKIFAQTQYDIDTLLARLEEVHDNLLVGGSGGHNNGGQLRSPGGGGGGGGASAKDALIVETRHFVTASKLFVKSASAGSFQLIDYLSECVTLLERMFHVSERVLTEMLHNQTQATCLVDRLKEVAATYAYTVDTVQRLVGYDVEQSRDGSNPYIDLMINHATSLATSLSTLMRTLRNMS